MRRLILYFLYLLYFLNLLFFPSACRKPSSPHLTIGSKFFTEQVILAELLAQHIEARTGIPVERKTNLGGTLLVHKALLAGDIDLYVEYTGTALTAVLNESPDSDTPSPNLQSRQTAICPALQPRPHRTSRLRKHFRHGRPRRRRAKLHLHTMSDLAPIAPKWHVGVGYEFLERPDGFPGWSQRYDLRFAAASQRYGPRTPLSRPNRSSSRYRRRQFHRRPHRLAPSRRSRRQSPLFPALRRCPHRSPLRTRKISHSFAPRSPISPAKSPPPKYAISTPRSTPISATSPPSSAPSAPQKISSPKNF